MQTSHSFYFLSKAKGERHVLREKANVTGNQPCTLSRWTPAEGLDHWHGQ